MSDFITKYYRLTYDENFSFINQSPREVRQNIFDEISERLQYVASDFYDGLIKNTPGDFGYDSKFTHGHVPQYDASIKDKETNEALAFFTLAGYERIDSVENGVPRGYCDFEVKVYHKHGFADFLLDNIDSRIKKDFPYFEEIDKNLARPR